MFQQKIQAMTFKLFLHEGDRETGGFQALWSQCKLNEITQTNE